jgi:hypothetical protein
MKRRSGISKAEAPTSFEPLVLYKRAKVFIPEVLVNVRHDFVAALLEPLEGTRQRAPLSKMDRPVERNPTHDTRMQELFPSTAYFPDPSSGSFQ